MIYHAIADDRPSVSGASSATSKSSAALLILAAAISVYAIPAAAAGSADWNPTSSEQLMKLPATHMKRAIERDFSQSGLATELRTMVEQISEKRSALGEFREAIELADGETKIELRHQALVEKQALVRLMGERLELQRDEATIRRKLYNSLLGQLAGQRSAGGVDRKLLLQQQSVARERLRTSLERVDEELFSDGLQTSRYAAAYSTNLAAIEKLRSAIAARVSQQQLTVDGEPLSREDYLRQMLHHAETSLALLDQEEEILGYMGKLVALDAMQLSDEIANQQAGVADTQTAPGSSVTQNVDVFLN